METLEFQQNKRRGDRMADRHERPGERADEREGLKRQGISTGNRKAAAEKWCL